MTLLKPEEKKEALDAWISAVGAGNLDALESLYGQTKGAVYGLALSLCQNTQDAEDVLQDTYVQVYRSARNYQPQRKAMSWIMTIARNQALMRLRERSRTVSLTSEEWEEALPAQPADDTRLAVESVLSGLNGEEQQIVMLHAVAGLKHREIGAMLQMPLPTVISKYNRALKKLRQQLAKDETL